MSKAHHGRGPGGQGRIPVVDPPGHHNLVFSFKYLDLHHPRFAVAECDRGYLAKFLERLQALCGLSALEFSADRSPALRHHPIDWRHTAAPEGFAHLPENLRDHQPFQFSISANEHGRVHGFIIDNVFFVVWLDPEHRLYP